MSSDGLSKKYQSTTRPNILNRKIMKPVSALMLHQNCINRRNTHRIESMSIHAGACNNFRLILLWHTDWVKINYVTGSNFVPIKSQRCEYHNIQDRTHPAQHVLNKKIFVIQSVFFTIPQSFRNVFCRSLHILNTSTPD